MTVAFHQSALSACPRAVALGCFDGVHVGHRALLARAAQTGLRITAVTFDPHPRQLVGEGVKLISSVSRRAELLGEAGVDDVLVSAFTREVAGLSPREWIASVLVPIGTRQVIVGQGFRFGHRRAGNADTIRDQGIEVVSVELQAGASSTRIRELIATGKLSEAERLLTRPVELEGHVEASLESGSAVLQLVEGTACPPPGRYRARTPSGHAEVLVRANDRLQVFSVATARVRPGERWCVQLDSSAAVVD